jgi:hypothetical protein
MTASDKVRNVIGGAIIIGTIVSLLINPMSIHPLVVFATIGIVAGVLLSLPGNIAGWISAVVLVFGIERAESALVARGAVFEWYEPVLIAASFAIATYYVVRLLKRKTPAKAGV